MYFFYQVVSEEEAAEEALFVTVFLKGEKLQLPVLYDPEHILDAPARTDGISGEQFTANSLTFCELVENAGYKAAIHSDMLLEAFELDLEQLFAYPVWYADYEPYPQTPYHFNWRQYTN